MLTVRTDSFNDEFVRVRHCPFCHGTNISVGDNYCCGNNYVLCNDCNGMIHDGESIEDVVNKWNIRGGE